jgi:hypothetical protein
VDSCVGLAPTNDRVAAGRFGFFSLQEKWCGALVTLQAGHKGRQIYRLPQLFTDLTPRKLAGEGFEPSNRSL